MKRILLLIFILLVIGGAVWYFAIKPKQTESGETAITTFKSFFPIGGNTTVPEGEVPNGQIPNTESTPSDTIAASPFTQLTSRPVAGYTAFDRTVTSTTPAVIPGAKPIVETVVEHIIRYVSRQNGFVYEIVNNERPLQISNIFIPNVYEAYFVDNNKTALLRFLYPDNKTIATYSVPIPDPNPDNTRTQQKGTYLQDSILSLAVSPNTAQVARLTTEQNSGVITISNSINTNKKELFRSPFREWQILWPNQAVFVQTKASSNVEGYLYEINQDKKLKKIIGNVRGLTTSISPNGTYVLYSESTNSEFTTKLLNTKTNVTKNLSLSILPEKCTWLKNEDVICAGTDNVASGVYPDGWYAGVSHFSDRLYRIYTSVNSYDELYTGDISFDMTELRIDETQNLLRFVDKTTGLLWQFKL